MSYSIDIKNVAISATGKYPQGDLTREMLQSLAESYNPNVHKARVRVAHASEYKSHNIPEAPVFAYVERLHVVDKNNRSFLVADLKAHEAFEKYKPFYPEYSIEFYDIDNPNNPTLQPHVNKPSIYLKGVAMLGATPPAVKGLESVSVSDYSEYRFNINDYSETKRENKMDTIEKLKDMLKASDEQEVVSKVEILLNKSIDYEKMYSESETAKISLENKIATLEKDFAEANRKLERKEFEVKIANCDEIVKKKVLDAFDSRGKEFAEDLLQIVESIKPSQVFSQQVVKPQSEKKQQDNLDFKSYSEWLAASISYDNNQKKKAYEFANKHSEIIEQWVVEKVNN